MTQDSREPSKPDMYKAFSHFKSEFDRVFQGEYKLRSLAEDEITATTPENSTPPAVSEPSPVH